MQHACTPASIDVAKTDHVLDSGGNTKREGGIRNYGKAWSLYMSGSASLRASSAPKEHSQELHTEQWNNVIGTLNSPIHLLRKGTPEFLSALQSLEVWRSYLVVLFLWRVAVYTYVRGHV
jgi:hypothetical protein